MIKKIKNKYISWRDKQRFIQEWHKKNKHNRTTPVNVFDQSKVTVGRYTYGPLNIILQDVELQIGDFCSIGPDVVFLMGGEHPLDRLLTFPADCWILHENPFNRNKGNTVIEDDVWIGARCTVLSGVHIGKGAVIAAGSVVFKDVPPFAIWGNGKVLKYRFNQEIRNELLSIDYSIIDESFIKTNKEIFVNNMKENYISILKQRKPPIEFRE